MVTYTFTNGTAADADEMNQNFLDTEDRDGFVLVDTTDIDLTSTGDKRTYTFNKAVNGLFISLAGAVGTGSAQVQIKKNGTPITTGFSYIRTDGGSGAWNWSDSSQFFSLGNAQANTAVFVNESISPTDTITLSVSNAAVTGTIEHILVQGINNKTTDTTWVSIT